MIASTHLQHASNGAERRQAEEEGLERPNFPQPSREQQQHQEEETTPTPDNNVSWCDDSLVTASLDRTREEVGEREQQEINMSSDTLDFLGESANSPQQQPPDDDETDRPEFAMGDHVYQWCSFLGIPAVFAHHGIVLDILKGDDGEWRLRVADFDNGLDGDDDRLAGHPKKSLRSSNASSSSSSPLSGGGPRIRTYVTEPALWRKVRYQAGFWRKHLARGGTATSAASDPPGLVRARVQFLLDNHARLLPSYDAVRSNCECVAVWCKTGTWATLQATSWLSAAAAGQVKSTVTLAGAAATTQVSVPAAGLWGWLGYTTQASILTTQPWLLPALAAYGAVTVGGPALWLVLARRHWKKLTQELNTAFWEAAVEHPDVFVEYILHWSSSTYVDAQDVNGGAPIKELAPVEPQEDLSCTTDAPSGSITADTNTEPLLPERALYQLPAAAMEKLSLLETHQEETSRIPASEPPMTQVARENPVEG